MNLQKIPEYLIRWIVTLLGIFLAIYLARSVASGREGFVLGIFILFTGIAAVLAMREKIWVLIPLSWSLTGQLPVLGFPFAARDLVILFVFTAFLLLKAFKIVRTKPQTGKLDIVTYLIIIYLVISFVRNPVGLEVIETERVGGRPYFICVIGFAAYWTLSKCTLPFYSANRMTNGIFSGSMLEGMLALIVTWFPFLAFISLVYVGAFLSEVNKLDVFDASSTGTGRISYLITIGAPLLLYLFARYPFASLLNPARPWRLLLVVVGFICIFLSGFRNALFGAFLYLFLSGYFHRGWAEVVRLGFFSCFLLMVLAIGNGSIFTLPLSAQRTLSWLPGQWDPTAVHEAKESTRWRTDMWKEMLTTDRYIENKVLGDGFGFTRRQLYLMEYFARSGDTASGQENFMISGTVHSGPVSSIRYGGYVGLFIVLTALALQAREAWLLIRRALPTPFRTLTLLVCMPIVIEPVFFTLIFGAYENIIPETFFRIGMLRMLANSLAAYEREPVPTMAQVSPERRRLVPTTSLACSLTPPVFSNSACE